MSTAAGDQALRAAMSRLRDHAAEALAKWTERTNAGEVSRFPQWAKDALDICRELDRVLDEGVK